MTPEFSLAFIGDVAYHLILPATSIVLVSIGGWMLGMRNTMIATNAEDYIVMAEAKGLRPNRVRYELRGAQRDCCPSVTAFGMSLGFVVGGALLTEVVFAYPGIGYTLLSAVQNLDYPLMQGHLPDDHHIRADRQLPRGHRVRAARPARARELNGARDVTRTESPGDGRARSRHGARPRRPAPSRTAPAPQARRRRAPSGPGQATPSRSQES